MALSAQINITTSGNSIQNFNSLLSTGVVNDWFDNNTIPNYFAQRSGSGIYYNSGTGSLPSGNLYSFGAAGSSERALGSVGSGSSTAGNFAYGVLLQNNSGFNLDQLTMSYTLEQWRNGGNTTPDEVTVWYKTSSSSISNLTPADNTGWTQVTVLTTASPINIAGAGALDGNLGANQMLVSNISIPNLFVPNGHFIMIKWEDIDHAGNDDGLGIDDVTLAWTIGCNTSSIITQTACNSYTWINNVTYTSSNSTATYLLTNISGGDSLVTLNLTIIPPIQDTLSVSTCGSYVWNGNTYTNSGVYVGATVNCVTSLLNLTISPNTVNNLSAIACDSYTWNGTTYASSGMYTGQTVNCVTEILDLTITPSSIDTTNVTACDSYSWNGDAYTSSGVYQGNTTNCTTEYLNLTIESIDVSISVSGITLSANTIIQGTTYQWVDCDANNTPIQGAVNQFFTASNNGNYAVIITQGNCEEMSACENISDVGMNELTEQYFTVFPNPSFNKITIERTYSEVGTFSIYDQQGRLALVGQLEGLSSLISIELLTPGTYILKVLGIQQPVLLLKN